MLRPWLCGLLFFSCSLSAQPPLRVVTELSPPHQTLHDGEVAGLSTELVKAILATAGVSAGIELYPWARSFRIASSQANVLIYNIARTPEREAQFHWIGTVAAYQLGFVALTHRSEITINQLTDASRFSIAVQRDDLAAHYLMKNGFKVGEQLVLAADITESWQLLLNGKVDLVVDDPVALSGMTAELGVAETDVRFVYAITELAQQTWLAASMQTSVELVERLKQAHQQVATSERYHQVMASEYR